MITSIIGKIFLEAYNRKYEKDYDAKTFFVEQYFPLFFDSPKYLQWVQNSPFVQMKGGQKVDTITPEERKAKLWELIEKIDQGTKDASVAIGYPASEEKEFATTSGQVSNINFLISKEDVYLSWFGASLGVGMQGGLSILFSNPNILLDIFEGWKLYRIMLDSIPELKGNQISTWNGQWISHRYDSRVYLDSNPMANFSPVETKNGIMSLKVQSWTKILIGISKTFHDDAQMIGYVYNFGQTNTTIGFIPFMLSQIRRPIELYQQLFGLDEGKKAELLYGTAFGFAKACQEGVIGIKAMEPKGLRDYMTKAKMPKCSGNEDETINFNVYIIWILVMLNNEEAWAKAQEFAQELQVYAQSGQKSKTGCSRKVDSVKESTNKINFIRALTDIVVDAENKDKIEEITELVNAMPSDNVPYFLTLVRFHYAAINNKNIKK